MLNAYSARVALWLRNTADTDEQNPWICTFGFHNLPGALGNLTAYVNDPANEWIWRIWNASGVQTSTLPGAFRAVVPTSVNLYRAEIAARDASGSGNSTVVKNVPLTGTNLAGTRTGSSSVAAQQPLALVIQRNTTTPGRRGRGRLYVPAITSDFAYDGQVTADATLNTAVTNMSTNLTVGWAGGGGAGYGLVLIGSDGISRPVTQFRLAERAGVQRRRLR